jgi:DNA-binding response OmpR family regulator
MNAPLVLLQTEEGLLTEVRLHGEPLRLSQRELALVRLLALRPGGTVLTSVLVRELRVREEYLYRLVARLRARLGREAVEHVGGRRVLQEALGVGSGYRLTLAVRWAGEEEQSA